MLKVDVHKFLRSADEAGLSASDVGAYFFIAEAVASGEVVTADNAITKTKLLPSEWADSRGRILSFFREENGQLQISQRFGVINE